MDDAPVSGHRAWLIWPARGTLPLWCRGARVLAFAHEALRREQGAFETPQSNSGVSKFWFLYLLLRARFGIAN